MADEPDQGTPISVATDGAGLNPTWTASVTIGAETSVSTTPVFKEVIAEQVTPSAAPGPPPLKEPVSEVQGESPVSPVPEIGVVLPINRPNFPPRASTPPPPVPVADKATSSILSEMEPPTVLPPPELAVTPPPHQPRSIPWRGIAIGGGLLAVIGGAVFFLWWQGIVFGAPRDATKALAKTVTALAKTPTYHAEGQATLKIGPPDSTAITTEAEALPDFLRGLKASADELLPTPTPTTDLEESLDSLPVIPEEAVNLGLSYVGDRVNETTSQLTISFDLSGLLVLLPPTIPPSIDLDIRRMGDTVYLRLPVLSLVLGSQSNKWLAFAERDLQSLTQESFNLTKIDPAGLARAIRSSERVGYERVGPVRTAHYRLTIDPLALIEVLQLKQSLDSLASTFSNLSITADVWLGTRDYLPYQYAISSHYLDQAAGVEAKLTLKTLLSQFGKKVAISAPREDEVMRDGLTGLLSGNFSNFKEKARDTQRKSDLSLIKSALELYKGDHGSYPSTKGAVTRSNEAQGPLKVLISQGYLSTLPIDPQDPLSWYGYQSSDGTSYDLWSIIEDKTDTTAEDRGNYRIYRLQNDRAGAVMPAPSATPGSLPTPSVSPTSGSARLPATS